MIDDPELAALGKTLELRFAMHIAARGHTYGYWIHEKASGRKVAAKSVWRGRDRGRDVERTVWTMGDAEFTTDEEFLKAYRQRLRDEEFDAAAPAEKTA